MDKKPEEPPEGVSRRLFLKGAGVAAAAVSVAQLPSDVQATSGTEDEPTILGPGPVPIQLRINGVDGQSEAAPSTTLLDLLRDHQGLTGAKRVCDRGSCGACTVLLDGRTVDSCSMLAIDAVGSEITTVEGIGTPENLSDLQQAFIEKDALQCGFCTPGMVVSCTALLKENPTPDREQIRRGISGNICRCGTYQNIIEAVQHVSRKGGK
ncbi:MAG: (2Fe-2S)-binding protein [Planctomycetota bacterium]|jgi:aerobic-type carbon monoxide dehydrogenase small subunit (CoxS/CutS family)